MLQVSTRTAMLLYVRPGVVACRRYSPQATHATLRRIIMTVSARHTTLLPTYCSRARSYRLSMELSHAQNLPCLLCLMSLPMLVRASRGQTQDGNTNTFESRVPGARRHVKATGEHVCEAVRHSGTTSASLCCCRGMVSLAHVSVHRLPRPLSMLD